MIRIFLAGLFGGIGMFIWTSIAHMKLPLGETGVSEIPNERAVVDAMQRNISEKAGFYIFPGFGLGPNPSQAEQSQAMKGMKEKLEREPTGILVYHSAGTRPFQIGNLLTVEFFTELAEAFLAVFLLAQTRLTTYSARVGFVAIVGVVAAIATNISYWNWYGFPGNYTLAYMFVQFVGFVCVGLIAALVLKNRSFPIRA
jgi:hypothetical protein